MTEYLEVAFNLPVDKTFTYAFESAVSVGCRVKAPFRGRSLTGFVVEKSAAPPSGGYKIKEIERVVDKEPFFGTREIEFARWMKRLYFCSFGEALSAMLPGGIKQSRIDEEPEEPEKEEGKLVLSKEQESGIERICSDGPGLYYLFGITGSGKTEVYLQSADRVLQKGGSVIYLVPEIALTHQIVKHVRDRFGRIAAVYHSRLTQSQRMEEWKRIRSGEARFIIGARSAVFVPAGNLGLIVIDEEHESSYKSGANPRYHARQLAMHRAAQEGAKVILGSATPSLEAYHLMQQGTIHRIELTKRLAGGEMPELRIVDLKHQDQSISSELAARIDHALGEKKQVLLFLNRRGFSYFFHCRDCGYEMKCRHCSVALTYHKQKNGMICHYCGYRAPPVTVCPECGSLNVGYSGFGTEKIEDEIGRLFPFARVGRIDTDNVQKRGALKKILADFSNGEIDILLGTQMVAKGHNFPKVDLVGIVLADTGLSLPDFRAGERTFQLLQQVAGRAGRYTSKGEVIIQTFRPENSAIKAAVAGDLEGFYAEELETRKMLRFPPFGRLFRFVFRGRSSAEVLKTAEKFADALEKRLSGPEGPGEILGPAACPISIISKNYRFQIIVRTNEFSKTHGSLNALLSDNTIPSGVYLEIDVDPVSLL